MTEELHVMVSKVAVAVCLAALGWAGSVSALTLKSPNPGCSVTSVTLGGMAADECAGIFDGNDSNQDLDGLFSRDWTFASKDDIGGSDEDPLGLAVWASAGTDGDWNDGEWGVTTWGGYSTVMVVLKAANSFSAFLFTDVGNDPTGMFNTLSNVRNNGRVGPALSHLSLYVSDDPAPVPVPAAGLLLAGALAGLGIAKRRRA